MKTVVIFGGAGFVGQILVQLIVKKDYRAIIPYQSKANEPKLRSYGDVGQVVPLKFSSLNEPIIKNIIKNSDIIINLKTIWEEKKQSTFKNNIFEFNKNLIKLVTSNNYSKLFIFFSGIGVDANSDSQRIKYIAETEEYIKKNCINYTIFKPAVIIGRRDPFLSKLIKIFRISLIIPLFGSGNTKLQMVYIDDLILACEKIISKTITSKDIFELAGEEIFSYKEFYQYLAECLNVKRIYIPIPFFIVSILIKILSLTPINLITKDQLILFKNDNISSTNHKTFKSLNIKPQNIRNIIKSTIDNNFFY